MATQVYIAIDGNDPPQQLSMGGGARQPATGVPTMSNSMFQNDAITVQQTTRGCFATPNDSAPSKSTPIVAPCETTAVT